nr:hypothetical protein [Tanacetum cinerariifolium]
IFWREYLGEYLKDNHREEEDQEGNDSSEIETLTYHVLDTYGLFLSSFATFDMSIIVIMYNEEDQEGNDSSEIEALTYHVLATYGLILKQPTGPALNLETDDLDTIDMYYKIVNLKQEVACLMLESMSPDLQRTLEKYNAYDMLKELKTMFKEQAKHELFETAKAFHACKHEKGQSVSSYLLKMKSYLDTLERLGYAIPNELSVSLILNYLNKDYDQFVQNYNMHSMGKTIAELHAMLKLHEKGAMGKDMGKNKLAYAHKPKIPLSPKRDNMAKDSVCHHCKEVGHWKRNCLSYQAKLKKRKNVSMASTSCIFTIELYAFPNKTWVYDTGCGTHIFNTLQGLRESRTLKHGALSLYMGNGMRAAVKAIGSFDLILPRYPKDMMGYYFYYPLKNKIFVARNAEFVENSLIIQEASGSHGLLESSGSDRGLELVQEEDIQPSENTSKIHNKVAPIKEYELWDLDEPPNYKVALSYTEFDKWLEAMNTEMQSIKDNQVWVLVDLPPNGQTVGSKWLFKKKDRHGWKCIGSIMYAVRCTRPDVAFTQNLCSRFQQNPGEIHWTTVKVILKYLRNTKYMVLVYGPKPEAELKVSCNANASFQTDKDDTKSQMGYVFVLNGGAMDWKSAKKITIAMYSIEAEYIAAAKASMEAVWIRKFIDGLRGVVPSNKRSMEMQCDNKPAIAITNNPGILKGSIHFQRKYHYIREVIQEREIVLKKVHTCDNVAYPFIKPMSYNKHYEHVMAMELFLLEVSCKSMMYYLVFG